MRHLKDEQNSKSFEELLRNSTQVLGRLRDILIEKDEALTNSELTSTEFNNPAWAFKEAYKIGRRSAIKEIKELLRFIP